MNARTALLLLAPLSLLSSSDGDDWSQFRGPDGRGVAAGEAAYPAALDPEANLRWKCAVQPGHSSPCVVGDVVFVTGHGEEGFETLCLDRATGEIVWGRTLAAEAVERVHRVNSPASSTPVSDGERVIVHFGSVGLVAYDLEGQELWRRELPIPENTFGSAASPILAGGKLVLVRDTNAESFLEALDPATGKTVWRRARDDFRSGWSTPVVWRRGDVEELLVYGVWWLTAYDLSDGSERWSVPGLTDEPITMPATADGLVLVTSYNMRSNPEVIGLPAFADLVARYDRDGDGQLDAEEAAENDSILSRYDADGEGDHPLRIFFRFLDADRDGEITATEWEKIVAWLNGMEHLNALLAIRPPEPSDDGPGKAEIVWQEPHGVPECPSPLVYGGRVWLVKNGGLLSCLETATGKLLYRERIDARGPYYASPVAGGGRIYTASARGVVTVLAAGDTFEVLSRNDLGERIMATPALVDGTVYVRTDEHVWAFGLER